MRAAVLRHSLGESFSEHVSEAAGVTVSMTTRARHVQGDSVSPDALPQADDD